MFPNTDFPLKFLVGKTGVAVILKNIDYRRNEFKRLKILEKNQGLVEDCVKDSVLIF